MTRGGKNNRGNVALGRARSSPSEKGRRTPMKYPRIVSEKVWEAAREKLLAKEKRATRARDKLAAARRRLPRVRIERDYLFEGPAGKASLLEPFESRRQLLLYQFIFGPNQDAGCTGCSMFID